MQISPTRGVASTGPVLVRCWQHRPSAGQVLAHNSIISQHCFQKGVKHFFGAMLTKTYVTCTNAVGNFICVWVKLMNGTKTQWWVYAWNYNNIVIIPWFMLLTDDAASELHRQIVLESFNERNIKSLSIHLLLVVILLSENRMTFACDRMVKYAWLDRSLAMC